MLLIVAALVKSGPGMAARRMQAACRAKAVLIIRTEKALFGMCVSTCSGDASFLSMNG